MSEARSRATDRQIPLWHVFGCLRGVAILGVLANHAAFLAVSLGAPCLAVHRGPGALAWAAPGLVALQELTRFAVPLFFFLAGHFAAHTSQTWNGFLGRSRRLLTPYLFWSLVGLGWSWTLFPPHTSGWGLSVFAWKLLSGEAQLGYFFTVLLIQFQFLSRWLIPLTARHGLWVPFGALAVQVCCAVWSYLALWKGWVAFPEHLFPRFLFFYSLGLWTGLEPARLKAFLLGRRAWIWILFGIAGLVLLAEAALLLGALSPSGPLLPREALLAALNTPWKLSTALWSLLFILAASAAGLSLPSLPEWLWRLGMHSYPIYILQGPIFLLLLLILSQVSLPMWLPLPILLLGSLLGTILLTRLVRRHLPWTAPFLLGD